MRKIKLRGIECYITTDTIKKCDMKEGYHYYCIRSNSFGLPETIEECAIYNRWGTVVCKKDLLSKETKDIATSCYEEDFYIQLTEKEVNLLITNN